MLEGSQAKATKAVSPGLLVKKINNQPVSTLQTLCTALAEPVMAPVAINGTTETVPYFLFESTTGDFFAQSIASLNVSHFGASMDAAQMCSTAAALVTDEQISGTKTNIACVGDSITEGQGSSGGMDYPNQLQTMLGPTYKVMNFGAGGRTMLTKGDTPYWTQGPFKEALASKPDIVVLMLGTNDARVKNWAALHAEFPIDYMAMIEEFKGVNANAKIYVMIPPPLYQDQSLQDGGAGWNQTVINSLLPGHGPAGVRSLAKAAGLPEPIDLFTLFQGHCPVTGGTPGHTPNQTAVPCDWLVDMCHPSNKGYAEIAASIKRAITHGATH